MTVLGLLFVSWLGLFLVFGGIGLLVRVPFRLGSLCVKELFILFWIGWSVSVAVLQAWHLLAPVGYVAFVVMSIAATIGIYLSRDQLRTLGRIMFNWRFLRYALALCAIAALVGVLSIGPLLYDTGLYHMGLVNWQTEHAIVPGLANLHYRFGFNNSGLLYFSMLEAGPWTGVSQHVGGGLLATALCGFGLLGLARLRAGDSSPSSLYLAASIVPAVLFARGHVSGMSTDYQALAIAIVLGLLLLDIRTTQRSSQQQIFQFCAVLVLAATAITVKLSLGVLAMIISFLAVRHLMRSGRRSALGLGLLLAGVPLALWVGRGFILSGYPAFPLTFGGLPVDWRVPEPSVERLNAVIGDWARWLGGYGGEVPRAAGEGTEWLPQWIWHSLTSPSEFGLALVFLSVGAYLLFMTRSMARTLPGTTEESVYVGLLLLPVGQWFLTAPDLRFVQGPLWVLALVALALGSARYSGFRPESRPFTLVKRATISGIVAAGVAVSAVSVIPPGHISDLAITIPQVPSPALAQITAESGLRLWVPAKCCDDRTYDASLPAAPALQEENLRLRVPGDLASGFASG